MEKRELTEDQAAMLLAIGLTKERRAEMAERLRKDRELEAQRKAEQEAAWAKRKAEEAAQHKHEDDAIKRIEDVLSVAGIKLRIGGCGCCGSPTLEAEFPDGLKVDIDQAHIDNYPDDLPNTAG